MGLSYFETFFFPIKGPSSYLKTNFHHFKNYHGEDIFQVGIRGRTFGDGLWLAFSSFNSLCPYCLMAWLFAFTHNPLYLD